MDYPCGYPCGDCSMGNRRIQRNGENGRAGAEQLG